MFQLITAIFMAVFFNFMYVTIRGLDTRLIDNVRFISCIDVVFILVLQMLFTVLAYGLLELVKLLS